MSLDLLGADVPEPTQRRSSAAPPPWQLAASIGGGLLGSVLCRRHPMLGLLNGFAVGGNIAGVVGGEVTVRRATENLGAHAIATVGSLSLPSHPALGYVAGAVASNLLIDRDRGPRERLETVLGVSSALPPSLDDVRAGRAELRRGMKGPPVEYVQALVGVVADGDFGPKTENAVTAWQLAHNLSATGAVDQKTLAALDKLAGRSERSLSTAPLVKVSTSGNVPFYERNVPGVNRPAWQVLLAGLAAILAGTGLAMVARS